jgi:hypothetical protein
MACTALPSYAQFSTFPTSSDNCSNVCVKLDLGSPGSADSFGFNNGGTSGGSSSNIRWQASVTWRPNAPEVTQAESERVKQRLEDNKTLITTLADAIAQNKPELARGIAIILAPRLNYTDPKILIAELKEGTIQIGSNTIKMSSAPSPSSPAPVTPTPTAVSPEPTIIELR